MSAPLLAPVRAWSALWWLLAPIAVSLLMAASATAAVDSLEVREYQSDFGVSRIRAEANLELQHRGSSLAIQLEETLGDDYAGLWFDNDRGEFVVPLLAHTDRSAVDTQLRGDGLVHDYRTVTVDSSWKALEGDQDALDNALHGLISKGSVQTFLDPRTNSVAIRQADGIGAELREKTQRLSVNTRADIDARPQAAKHFGITPTACTSKFHVCGNPLRGGVSIAASFWGVSDLEISGGGTCTAGFKAVGNTYGNRFILTAGHCVEYDNFTSFWKSFDDSLGGHSLGEVEQYALAPENDYAKINVNGSYWDIPNWPVMVANWGSDLERPITTEAPSYLGEYVCHSGSHSGVSCGSVTALDMTSPQPDSVIKGKIDPIEHRTEFQPVCTEGGDSGGPVYAGNTAVGIMTDNDQGVEGKYPKYCEERGYYTEITEADDALGVTVAPRVGAPPIAKTGGSSEIQAQQVTLGGTVDPNGLSTTYHFDYGKTTAYGSSSSAQNAGSGWSRTGVSTILTGLQPGTPYHYRLVGTNSAGTSIGQDHVFTTSGGITPSEGEDDYSAGPRGTASPENTVNVFYRTPSGGLGHDWHVPWESGWGSETLGGSVASELHPIVDKDGGINVFYRTPSGGLGHEWWEVGGSSWGVETLGGSLAANAEPHAIVDGNKIVHVFYRTPSGGLGHDWHVPWESGWGMETLPGSVASEPHPIVDKDGGINVFYRTPSGGLGHEWWEVGGSSWGVETLPGSLGSNAEPHAIVDKNNVVNVFFRTTNNGLGHVWHVPWECCWGSEALGGTLAPEAEPHAVVDKDGGVNVFFHNSSGGLGHVWWEVGGTQWGYESLPGSLASEPHAIVDPVNKTVNVFYRTPSGGLGHNWHVPWESGWGSETLGGSLASEPHAVIDKDGGLNVFYRTPSGGLGHDWFETGGSKWGVETLAGSLAARPPVSTTGSASSITSSGAKVEGTVNPEGSPASYYFEYGTTTAYGSKQPASAKEVGYGYTGVSVSETLGGLSAGTTYHYRLVATSPEGTTNGVDKTFTTQSSNIASKLASMAVTEPFNGSTESLANFGSKWSTLGWASGKGQDVTAGWGPTAAYSAVNGAYYTTSASDSGSGVASVVTMAVNPANTSRYFSLWLDASGSAASRSGYEVKFLDTAANTYEVKLSKWTTGAQTLLATKTGYSFVNGNSLAVVDQGSTVSVWTSTDSAGFTQLLSGTDSTYSSGNAGLEGSGNITRLHNFKVGGL